MEFRPSVPDDLPAIRALLQAGFGAQPDAPFLNEELLRWKYFQAARGFVLADGPRILAHGCAWPVPKIGGICLIDWVSVPHIPGMGVMFVKQLARIEPVMLSIGGSAMTQKIMPKIGFEKRGELLTYARVLKPWRQFQTRPGSKNGKAIARLLRNLAWSFSPTAILSGAEAIPGAEGQLHCPAAKVESFQLRPAGSAMVTRVSGQTRIAQIAAGPNLAAACAALIQEISKDPATCEVIALAPDGRTRAALEANGFRQRANRSVFVHDPKRTLTPDRFPLPLDMLDDDMFYMDTPEYPFLT